MAEAQKHTITQREETVLAFWNKQRIFEKSLQKEAPKGDYIFYDGPPFATGTPHYGHIVASVIKDVVPRFWTMRGYHVPRKWGWDCHGLPIENIVEKELGTKHKKDIEAFGVAKFNELCRSKVLTYVDEWKKVVPRIGRWADMENPYFTMSKEFMESVWWVFKQLYEKGLVYEDYRSMYICPRCETTLSQSEVAEGYKEVKDLAVTVKCRVKNPERHGLPEHTYLLAWTTTPWTLPGNVALAVGRDVRYAVVPHEGAHVVRLVQESDAESVVLGADLVGIEYEPIFDAYANDSQLKNRENGWRVYAADFVTTDAGTGIVHIAPAFGADDMALAKEHHLPFVQHVGMDGIVKPEVSELAGRSVKPADDVQSTDVEVIKYLAGKGLLFAKEKYEHSYPHCWRCDTPLINYATSSWFVRIESQKDALLHTAKPIHWSPEHIKEGRWGKWLLGARDWSISRQRFWASVIPMWRCEICKAIRVFGSAAELEEASGKKIDDLHKHIVDDVTVPCTCGQVMKRVPDVLDTWFDSGSMPYGQAHYPFEHKEEFERTFPARFIAEGQDQCRAWFYYLHVLAGSVFGSRAFEHVIVNGIVLAEDGKKMSKKLKNYADPMEVVTAHGADSLRLYLLASPVMQAENLNFSEKGVVEWKGVLTRLENVLSFYQLYRESAAHEASATSAHVLDQWIVGRLTRLQTEVTEALEAYDLASATRPLSVFIDDLSTWYLRRSRERIKGDDITDKTAALATTLHVLRSLAVCMAPHAPFMAEHIWQTIKTPHDAESVHLCEWYQPARRGVFARLFRKDRAESVIAEMSAVRRIVSEALEAREKAGIKVRQPLAFLQIPKSVSVPSKYYSIIADEVNVKRVTQGEGDLTLDTVITAELQEEGFVRDFVREIQAFRKEQRLNPGQMAAYRITASLSSQERAVIEKHRSEIQNITTTTIEFS